MAKQDEPLELTVRIKDFGPISRGEIALKPLTILVGPNNSGKSYAAMLLHSIFDVCCPAHFFGCHPTEMRLKGPEAQWLSLMRWFRWWFRWRLRRPPRRPLRIDKATEQQLRRGQGVSLPQATIKRFIMDLLEQAWERDLGEELERSMGCQLHELVSIGRQAFDVEIRTEQYATSLRGADKLELMKGTHCRPIEVRIEPTTAETTELWPFSSTSPQIIEFSFSPTLLDRSEGTAALANFLSTRLSQLIFEATTRPCYYLPAARSGILQGYRPLASSIIGRAPLPGVGARETPGLSGVVADFLSILVSLPHERGELYHLGRALEREAMQGEVTLQPREGELPREIRYRYRGADIPLHRSSSTVSELAPLVLYLKYVVTPGSVLIIEEPEAHLHPANQRIVAKYLARLVRRGVYVLVTTHSDWLVEQLSSLVKLGSLDKDALEEKFPDLKNAVLSPSDVGLYVFSYDKRSRGHRIKAIEVDEDGIPEDEFLRIHEELYEENIAIERARERG